MNTAGTSINGVTEWVHDFSNDSFTYLALHKKRGFKAIKDIGLLTDYIKIKTKVSGFFKTEEGAKNFKIMSFVSTARKLGISAYEAVRPAVIGEPWVVLW